MGEEQQHGSFWTTESNRFEAIQAPSIERDGPFGLSVNAREIAHLNEGSENYPNDQIAIDASEEVFAWDRAIRIDKGDRLAVSVASTFDIRLRRTASIGALILAIGGLGWIGGSNLSVPGVSPATRPIEQANRSISTPDPVRSVRTEVSGLPTSLASTGSGTVRAQEMPKSDVRTTNLVSPPKKQNPSALKPTALQRSNVSERRVPVPETRPTTIDGWTVREVNGGTALLEGPNGIWKAERGDTVPGVGKIDLIVRWGNRWIVATSRGLISTR